MNSAKLADKSQNSHVSLFYFSLLLVGEDKRGKQRKIHLICGLTKRFLTFMMDFLVCAVRYFTILDACSSGENSQTHTNLSCLWGFSIRGYPMFFLFGII